MEALILSCGTGGGHNTAAQAIAEELSARGHHVAFFDPYELAGETVASTVSNVYIRMAQKAPWLFGVVYALGNAYRRLPIHSPVYAVNGKMVAYLQRYLQEHPADVMVTTHLFPAEIWTRMKRQGLKLPLTMLIATDYTCIPFMEETDCDFVVTPSPALNQDFRRRGIPEERLLSFGIPVRRAFRESMTREEARQKLRFAPHDRYILISGGSIGAGKIYKAIRLLSPYLQQQTDRHLIVLCGNNHALYSRLTARYGDNAQIQLLQSTDDVATYMRACDLFISKPGGLSSTEAAVSVVPFIHMSPIPGCESRNAAFFSKRGMSLSLRRLSRQLLPAVEQMQDKQNADTMRRCQAQYINRAATEDICDFLEKHGS